MKTLNSNSIIFYKHLLLKPIFSIFMFFTASSYLNAQVFNPDNGFTHYPNGTVYIPNVTSDGGIGPEPVVIGPDGETVGCTTDEARCKELLEDAAADTGPGDTGTTPGGADGGDTGSTPGGSEGGSESGSEGGSEDSKETSQSYYSPEVKTSSKAYKKQLKIKYGVWSNQKGKWIYASSPQEWTIKIVGSWGKNKKKIKKG